MWPQLAWWVWGGYLPGFIEDYIIQRVVGKSWCILTQTHNIFNICLLGKGVHVPSAKRMCSPPLATTSDIILEVP